MRINNVFRRRFSFSATMYVCGINAVLCAAWSVSHASDAPAVQGEDLNTIVVTAEKREERLQDVPIPISVVNTQSLQDNNQVRLQDFYTQVPSVTVTPGTWSTGITIRGITTGQAVGTTPTVGITVDDLPFGSSIVTFVPELDPGDLERIEVLRGPQGALYGSSSMGGVIRYVTADPSTDSVSGRVESGASSIYNGAELGYTFRASVNMPLSDNFAVRVSGFTRQDPGFIDNTLLGINGINEDRANGARLVALWRPTDTLSIKLSSLYQDIRGDGSDFELNGPGSPGQYQQSFVKGVGNYDNRSQNYGLVVKDKVGIFDLTSVSGYSAYSFSNGLDYSSALGFLSNQFFGVNGAPLFGFYTNTKLDQEFRVSFSLGRLDTTVGAYYTHEYVSPAVQILDATNPISGAFAGQLFHVAYGYGYDEYAGFTDLTYHFTDQFALEVGGRESHIDDTYNAYNWTGPYGAAFVCGADPCSTPAQKSSSSPFTYLASPQFKITPDLMVYARVASGYRSGGPNATGPGIPPEYQPDKTYNYEIGTKDDFLDHKLSVDASIYYIDWKNIQTGLQDPISHLVYTGNAGTAKSEGVEVQVESRPLQGLTISSWLAWSEAIITSVPANLSGLSLAPGDRLPYSPRVSGNVAVNQEFALSGELKGFVGGTVSYVGNRYDTFEGTAERPYLPPYAKTDLRTGVKHGTWTVNLYANNVTNKRGLLSGSLVGQPGYYYIQPRLLGFTVSSTF
jgi:iron complex outermembrane receptor protein